MPILLDGTPTFIIPVFQQTGFVVQYKPFSSFYQWTDFIDFTEFDTRITAIEASIPADLAATLDAIVTELGTLGVAVVTAQAAADLANAAAAAVQSNLDATNTNVTAAAAAAAAAQTTANGAVTVNGTQATAITAAQTDATAALAAAAAAQTTANAASPSTTLPRRGHFHSEEQSVITGTEARNTDGTIPFAGGKYTSTQNAEIQHYFTCRAGTSFVVSVLALKASSYATVTMYLDGTLIHTEDLYAAVTDKAFVFGQSTGAIAAGDHTLSFKALTKNPSSSSYLMFINFVKWVVS